MYQAFNFFFLQTPSLIFNEHHIFLLLSFPLFKHGKNTPSYWNLLYLEQKYLARLFSPLSSSTINPNEQNPVVVWGLPVEWPCCSLGVLPQAAQRYDLISTECSLRVRSPGRWYFPHNNTICSYFPTSVSLKVCPSERLWVVCFHFWHSNFHLEVKVRSNGALLKYHNIQFCSGFGECFITFLKQMSGWSKGRNEGIFNVSPYFIFEQINFLILQGEVMARKATQALV